MQWLKIYLACFVTFIVLDLGWLGFIAKGWYDKYLSPIRTVQTDWLAAFLFYFIFIGCLIFFAIAPMLESDNDSAVLFRGALLGLMVYGTYDLVNRAVLNHWPWPIAIIDILWGLFICAAVTWVGWKVGRM